MTRRLAFPCIVALVLTAGCSETGIEGPDLVFPDSEPPPSPSPVQVDRIVQVTTPSVDVLFTIDNSGSMEEEQTDLRENFPIFMDFFVGSGLDYHIGVISTDMADPGHSGRLSTASGKRWIDVETTNPNSLFSELASLGIMGSGIEKGLQATYACIEEQDGYNGGFYRDNASIHTLVISDEGDSNRGRDGDLSVNEFINWYDSLKPDRDYRTFSAIVHIDGPIPPQESKGDEYISVANEIGGVKYDIKLGEGDSYEPALELLGITASGLNTEFFLSKLPVPESIEVEVQKGAAVIVFDSEQWEYNERRNSISFVEFVPDALSEIVVRYTELGVVQAFPEEGVTTAEL